MEGMQFMSPQRLLAQIRFVSGHQTRITGPQEYKIRKCSGFVREDYDAPNRPGRD